MSRILTIVLFLCLSLSLIGGLHYYFWARLVRDTALPAPWRQLATVALIMAGLSMPVTMILWRTHSTLGRALAWPAFVWMGMLLILTLVILGSDFVRLMLHVGGGLRDPERRLLLSRLLGGAAAAIAAGLGVVAYREGTGRVGVKEVEVKLAKLPRELDGFVLVQLTDVHVGPTIGRRFIEEIVRTTNALKPDLVAITGDLVDGSVAELGDSVAPLSELESRHGTFFVTGNHEYYAGVDEWTAHLPSLGIKVLRNERVTIGGAAGFDLAGVDDYHARPDLERALAGRDESRALVLLAHQPKAVLEAAARGVCLQLSGHTHGGQIWPWGYAVRLQQPYVAGLARHGETMLYVSRGTGYWGPPMRLNAPAEITRITLRRS
jgi:predicted MPP superfamily phosphohydrolase